MRIDCSTKMTIYMKHYRLKYSNCHSELLLVVFFQLLNQVKCGYVNKFSLQLSGFDNEGNQIKRLLTTIIKANAEMPPKVFMDRDEIIVTEGEKFSVKCDIDSSTPEKVLISHEDNILKEIRLNPKYAYIRNLCDMRLKIWNTLIIQEI